MADEAFSIDKRPLRDLLQQIEVGKAQLPEFGSGVLRSNPARSPPPSSPLAVS
ncbi:hypothetical protein AB0A71_26035 [Kitasatospora aureofaciens]|uniref:hypothetical protein n=1 Tax=Kitasatospora aureofaciens TaxID=1894 RepID=UPI0033C7C8D2